MIRPTTPDDSTALIAIADAIGFQPNELEYLSEMLVDYFGGDSDSDHFWITDDDNGPVGVAYCEAERMTNRTWNLQLISDLSARDKDAVRHCYATLNKL